MARGQGSSRIIHTTPVARKHYQCDDCGGSISPGEQYHYFEYWDKWDSQTGKHVEHFHNGCGRANSGY